MTKTYLAIAFLITGFGCVTTKTISHIPYTPVQGTEPWFAETGPKVFIHEFDNETAGEISHGFDKSVEVSKRVGESLLRTALWPFFLMGPDKPILPTNPKNIHPRPPICGTVGGINCPQLFKNVFTKEFQALGLQVVENANEAQVIMKGKILRFESLRLNLSLEFVDQNGNLLLQEKLGAFNSRPVLKSKEGLIGEIMHELFSKFYKDPVYPSYFPVNLRTVLKEVSNKP
jgi:hypothetical protein